MFFEYVIVILVAVISVNQCKTNVPVLIWGTTSKDPLNLHVPALKKLSTVEFYENIVKKVISNEQPAIALFIEESLSLEDLRWEDTVEKSLYSLVQEQIQSHNFKIFVPYVNNPVKVLQSLTKENIQTSAFDASNSPNASRNVFLIELDDAKDDEDRTQMLRRHDKVIYETCKSIEKKYGNTICILTASRESWIEPEHIILSSRKLLYTAAPSYPTLNVYYAENVGLLYTKSHPRLNNTKLNELCNVTITATTQITKNGIGFLVKTNCVNVDNPNNISKVQLQFNFAANNKTWQLDNILLIQGASNINSETLKPSVYIGASFGYSFHTPAKVIFQNSNYTLVFDSLQVELFSNGKKGSKFSVADDTVYFFTIPILSGLFVTSLLVTIVLIGLSMIFDIKTMDLFDDPKGKTVTINASE